jgi:hypothetical protein
VKPPAKLKLMPSDLRKFWWKVNLAVQSKKTECCRKSWENWIEFDYKDRNLDA